MDDYEAEIEQIILDYLDYPKFLRAEKPDNFLCTQNNSLSDNIN